MHQHPGHIIHMQVLYLEIVYLHTLRQFFHSDFFNIYTLSGFGDEFIAFCHGLDNEMAISNKSDFINDRLVDAAKKLMGEDMNIPLGASIGCVFVPKEGTDFADLYKKADKALYKTKTDGRNGYCMYKDI